MNILNFLFQANFSKSCSRVREATYGIKASSRINQNQVNITTGTAFMIAPDILATVAHVLHRNNDLTQPRHPTIQVIRAPDVGLQMEVCDFIAEDTERDLALLRIANPRNKTCTQLISREITKGTPCGSFGFPLAFIDNNTGTFSLVERFQGAHISSFHSIGRTRSGRELLSYETDALMYKGSSGCPGFLSNGKIFGMHNASMIDQPRQANEGENRQETRLAISLWVPAKDIAEFAKNNGINL